jgi:hypothetical protein
MPITVAGTSITFNDSTTQSTANNTPANTTNVLAATAGATVGAVGTYAFLYDTTLAANTGRTPGATLAGSSLRYIGVPYLDGRRGEFATTPLPSGTWRLMGYSYGNGGCFCGGLIDGRASLWLRIS